MVLDNIAFVLGPVSPMLVLLWFASALGLACLIVYLWQRVFKV